MAKYRIFVWLWFSFYVINSFNLLQIVDITLNISNYYFFRTRRFITVVCRFGVIYSEQFLCNNVAQTASYSYVKKMLSFVN